MLVVCTACTTIEPTEKAFEIEEFSGLDSVFHSAATIRWMRASAESHFARPTDEERRAAIYVLAS